jgi:hypothetical protein
MPDPETSPTPASDAPSRPPGRRKHPFWRRVRLYGLSILLIGAIYFYGAARLLREHPQWLAEQIFSRLPYPASVGHVAWLDANRIDFRDVKLGDFFFAPRIIVTASPYQLLRHHINEVEIRGAQLFTGPLNDALRQGGSAKGGGIDWTITKLVIVRGTLTLQNLAPDMPGIPIRLGAIQPIILNYIHLARPDDSPSMTRERTVEIENVVIVSPFDPLSPVLSFPLVRVRFNYGDLWKHHLYQVDLVRPVIHLGQDLFWFSDQFKKERATLPANPQGVDAPWRVDHFEVRYGQLAINAFGQPAVQFPFFFDTDVDNIRLDQLDKITAKSVIPIRELTIDYPDYKIKIVNLHGKLEFSIPPSNASANNVVPTISIQELSWNGIAATNVWTSVTFDPTGIYGKLGGTCEHGYMKGNLEVYYTKGFAWNADLFADSIDCAPIAQKLAGKYFSLTGTLDGKIAVQGQATEILHCQGKLTLAHPGLLDIHSVDDLMKRLPGAAGSLQHQALGLALDAFRTYPYQTGVMDINYRPQGGEASLKLDGPRGQRHFSVVLHPLDGTSKIAKTTDSQ